MKILAPVCMVAILLAYQSVGRSQTGAGVPQEWGAASDGLRIGIVSASSRGAEAEGRQFSVAVENVGERDVVLNLGYMLANGKVMFPTAVTLVLGEAEGRTRELHYFDRRYAGIAGRVDDFTVALRAGSAHILRLTLDQYSPGAAAAVTLAKGRYRIAARLDATGASSLNLDTKGIALLNFWRGTLQSNWCDFSVS